MICGNPFNVIVALVVCTNALLTCTDAYYLREPVYDYGDANLERGKRYTETQDRASSFCTGMCMYEERKAYSDCFDLCNWHGQGPSPWVKLDHQKDMDGGDNSVDSMKTMFRSGSGGGGVGGKGKGGDKSKAKTKGGMKRWNFTY